MKTRRFYFALALLLVSMVNANAKDIISVNNVTVPKGGEVTLEIGSSFETSFIGFQLDIELADGLSLATDDEGQIVAELGSNTTDHGFTGSKTGNVYSLVCASMNNRKLPTGDVLMRVILKADASLEIGTIIPASVKNIIFSEKKDNDQIKHVLDDVNFTITVGEPADPRTILDENSTTAPTAASNVDIRVKRTINANSWSTICLPFAMTEAQTKAVFGNDVELAEFTGADSEFDGDNVVGIKVNFSSVSSIAANTPYIIKVSSAVSEFTLDGVDITPDEDEAYIEFDNGKTGSRRVVYSGFYGTYHTETPLDEYTVFLSGGKFWYSMGETKMKGYRAYFSFLDILTEVENASVKIFVDLGGEETGIENINVNDNSMIYDLSGRRVSKAQKGVYIVNGKKVMK